MSNSNVIHDSVSEIIEIGKKPFEDIPGFYLDKVIFQKDGIYTAVYKKEVQNG